MQWSGIQVLLEQAESDVLILLDCCAAGTANAGGGSGVTELIAACAFNATANGVGPHSFTNALVIELTELSRKPSFPLESFTATSLSEPSVEYQSMEGNAIPLPFTWS